MLEKIGDLFMDYCMWVFALVTAWIEKTHGVVGVGVPMLVIVAMNQLCPVWVNLIFVVGVVVPSVSAMAYILLVGLSDRGQR